MKYRVNCKEIKTQNRYFITGLPFPSSHNESSGMKSLRILQCVTNSPTPPNWLFGGPFMCPILVLIH